MPQKWIYEVQEQQIADRVLYTPVLSAVLYCEVIIARTMLFCYNHHG